MSDDDKEIGYEVGRRQAWRAILAIALRELEYDDPEAKKAIWIIEREDIINRLRSVCADFGDNDWPDKLHLGDVIDKHLARYLYDNE